MERERERVRERAKERALKLSIGFAAKTEMRRDMDTRLYDKECLHSVHETDGYSLRI